MDQAEIVENPRQIETKWPELLEDLPDRQRENLIQVLAISWHGGVDITRENVKHITDSMREELTIDGEGSQKHD